MNALGIVIAILLVTRMIDRLPWWGFVIPAGMAGAAMQSAGWKMNYFLTGFFAGSIVWIAAAHYYDLQYGGLVLIKLTGLFRAPAGALLAAMGLIGGLTTGLAFYAGKNIVASSASLAEKENIW